MPMFGKRDYVWLASVARDIRRNYDDARGDPDGADLAIETISAALKGDSPGFDVGRFNHNVYCDHDHVFPDKCPYIVLAELDEVL